MENKSVERARRKKKRLVPSPSPFHTTTKNHKHASIMGAYYVHEQLEKIEVPARIISPNAQPKPAQVPSCFHPICIISSIVLIISNGHTFPSLPLFPPPFPSTTHTHTKNIPFTCPNSTRCGPGLNKTRLCALWRPPSPPPTDCGPSKRASNPCLVSAKASR